MRLTMRVRLSRSLSLPIFASVDILIVVATRWSLTGTTAQKANDQPRVLAPPYRPLLNPLFVQLSLEYALHVNAGCVHCVRIQFTWLNQVLYFSDGCFCRRRHHRIEIARRLTIDKIAPFIAFPRLDQGKISVQRVFHQVHPPTNLVSLSAPGNHYTLTRHRIIPNSASR